MLHKTLKYLCIPCGNVNVADFVRVPLPPISNGSDANIVCCTIVAISYGVIQC